MNVETLSINIAWSGSEEIYDNDPQSELKSIVETVLENSSASLYSTKSGLESHQSSAPSSDRIVTSGSC